MFLINGFGFILRKYKSFVWIDFQFSTVILLSILTEIEAAVGMIKRLGFHFHSRS